MSPPFTGSLERHGVAAVLEAAERHGWNLASVAREFNVDKSTPRRYLKRHVPDVIAAARAAGKRGRSKGNGFKFNDPVLLERVVLRYRGSIKHSAKALRTSKDTLVGSLKRLKPDLYRRLPEIRRAA